MKPKGKPALQQPRRNAAELARPVFERQRHAGRPHAAHADAKQAAEGEQHDV